MLIVGGGLYLYLRHADSQSKIPAAQLSADAKQYTRNLKLSEVQMKATESYLKQAITEVNGKITNSGDRPLAEVDVYCVFYDAYGQVVLRQRVSIVSPRMGGLKPSDTKSFRLPFDEIPASWNQTMPQLVIAGITFS